MIIYWLLLLPVATISYLLGSMSTLVLASNFVFHTNLRRLGKGNNWLTNFRRVYGIKGAMLLLLVELVKDIIPIIIGGALLGIKGHVDVGRAFAGFCIVMGRLWPVYYNLKGSHAIMPVIVTALFADKSLGIALIVLVLLVLFLTKYVSLAAFIGALALMAATVLIVESRICIYLILLTGAAVLVRHFRNLKQIADGKEEKINFSREDLTYKFDNIFK